MKLLYVVDPMCSWCYGFAPTLDALRNELCGSVQFELVMGGLAPDSDEPMPPATAEYVQAAWHAVTERTGVAFNHNFWRDCQPRRSTYPACRAVILAREEGREWDMLAAIQRAYYQDAMNPSDTETLVALAQGIGLDRPDFEQALQLEKTQAKLQADFGLRESLGATSFPSLGLERDGNLELIAAGCLGLDELRLAVERCGVPIKESPRTG